jgi:tRNA pseudouridine38-40 synthase
LPEEPEFTAMIMKRFFITLAYDGTRYHGWQVQPNATTVQETLEKAFSVLMRQPVSLTGCGRTDTGVHASHFVAHMDIGDPDTGIGSDLVYKLNGYLPDDIVVYAIEPVKDDMHARYSALYREYEYRIRKLKPVFERSYCHYYSGELNVDLMNESCSILMEYRDFTSFSKLHTDVKTNNCQIMKARWDQTENGYNFIIRSDRFLRNMVRSVVGTMMEIGKGKMSLDEFRKVIESKDRGKAGTSAPAKGLFLVDVGYESITSEYLP